VKGSVHLKRYLRARRAGQSRDEACAASGISAAEAELRDRGEEAGEYADIDTTERPTIGHNSGGNHMSENVAADQLRLFIERIERLEEEKKGMAEDIRDVYAEAKALGFDSKTMRKVVALRKMEKNARDEADALLDTYRAALGMDYCSTPLGAATLARAA
jgi:uncharacterized protein (UPF0335 family)